jgi:hypothetical protein
VHNSFIMILEKVLNWHFYIYIKNNVLQCQGICLVYFCIFSLETIITTPHNNQQTRLETCEQKT